MPDGFQFSGEDVGDFQVNEKFPESKSRTIQLAVTLRSWNSANIRSCTRICVGARPALGLHDRALMKTVVEKVKSEGPMNELMAVRLRHLLILKYYLKICLPSYKEMKGL